MRRILLVLSAVVFLACIALGQVGDLGAQIAAQDAELGASPGVIHVTSSGTISEGKVSLSSNHDLVCDNNVTIFLDAGSYLYQSSQTSINNCIISATSTPIAGEVQSINTSQVSLEKVTFVGGGNLVYWSGVTYFHMWNNNVVSITAVDAETTSPKAGFYLVNCSKGTIDKLTSAGFVFPQGFWFTAILQLDLSSQITISNSMIQNVDASYIRLGAAAIEMNGSHDINVYGGTISHNANMDGVLTEGYPTHPDPTIPSSHITISGLNSSYNGALGLNQDAPLALGDALDIINTSHVRVSHCILNGNGNPHDQQPGIWFFLDDDVEVSDSDLSENSASGVSAAGTPGVRLIRDTINRNQASGVFTEWQGAAITNVGPAVTFSSGPSGGFGLDWLPGTPAIVDGVIYRIVSVSDSGHLTLSTAPPDHSTPVSFGVNTTQDITDTTINDNGVGRWSPQVGDQYQVGISWADGTTGTISGVTSGNTGIGAQLYALELANTSSVTLYNDNFSGNLMGGTGIFGSLQSTSTTSLSFSAQQVGTTSPAQTIILYAGMIVIPDLVIQAVGDFSQTNNCGFGLAGFATCQIQVKFTPTTASALSGAIIIADTAPNSPQVISLSGTGMAQGLGLSIANGASDSQTVAAGNTAKYLLSIGGSGFAGVASLSCTGAPADATCTTPGTEAVSATQLMTFAVTVSTQARSNVVLVPQIERRWLPWLWALGVLGVLIFPSLKRPHRVRAYLLSLLILLLLLSSCGGAGSTSSSGVVPPGTPPKNSTGTPAGHYTLTIGATIGKTSQQIPIVLTVQ